MKADKIMFLAALLLLGPGLWGQEKKHYLTPAEAIKIMEASPTAYRMESSLEKLKPEEKQDLAMALFPADCAPINYPHLVQKDGRALVQEFLFKNEAVALLEKAETYFARKDYEEANKNYELALKADPDCYMAIANIGDCYQFMGQSEKALPEYDRAILKNPNDHRLHYFRGNALLNLGRVEEAKKSYLRSLMLRPRYSFALQVMDTWKDLLKISVRASLFHPRALVRREGEEVCVYVDLDKGGLPWLAYANAKAVWLGEASHRQEMTGKSEYAWSMAEERECLANLLAMYAGSLAGKTIQADPDLDLLQKIFDNGDIDLFILYEVYTRLCPVGMLVQPAEIQGKMEQYIQKYMVRPL
jgi:tetratricopeptide (TPR) repeat protein